jgi:hypothetical protein
MGYFNGSVDFGGGPLTSVLGSFDIFLAKFDSAGNHLWSKRFGGASNEYPTAVAVDGSGNAFLTGDIFGSVDFGGGLLTSAGGQDIFLAKFDPAGNHLWSKRFGDTVGQLGKGIAVDGSGNAFLTGAFFGSVDFGGGPLTSAGLADIFLAKFAGTVQPVGGIAEQPDLAGLPSRSAAASSGSGRVVEVRSGVIVAALAIAVAGAWAVRRRRHVA